jgi:hypothetical protein
VLNLFFFALSSLLLFITGHGFSQRNRVAHLIALKLALSIVLSLLFILSHAEPHTFLFELHLRKLYSDFNGVLLAQHLGISVEHCLK